MYFEGDDGASNYFLYSALIHDPYQRLRRYALRELLLMMNWRIVNPLEASLYSQLVALLMSIRRLAPLTLLALALGALLSARFACLRARRRHRYRKAL